MKRLFTIVSLPLIMVLFINSAWVKLTLIKPARINIPVDIRNLALIDRTAKEETTETKLEEVLTGEIFQQDEQAIGKLMEGTIDLCANKLKYEVIRTGERLKSEGTKNVFPQPLSWSKVSALCTKYKADALYVIEIFDSDFIVTNNPFEVETKDKDGNVVKTTQFRATGIAVINIGIRIYDPKTKQIADEFRDTQRLTFDASGSSIDAAVNSLLDKVEAINKAAYETGFDYGKRISPWYYKVTRYFYNKPKKSKYIQEGVRKSEVADWQGAIESWEKVFTSKDKKDQKAHGKAALNIAVAYEVLGDLDKAKEWAAKSYTEYEDNDAADYYKDIQNRIKEERIVKNQLGQHP